MPRDGFVNSMEWLTAFVNVVTIIIVKDGGFFGHPQFDMGNVG